MAVKLRLKRMGSKKRPFYRIVATDSRNPRDGKSLEEIGYYNPIEVPVVVKINEEASLKWLNNGAIPTDTVRDLFSREGIMKKFHDSRMIKKDKPAKVEKPKKEKAPAKEKPVKTEKKKATVKKDKK